MPDVRPLEFTCSAQAAPEEVSRAFTHPTMLRDWLGSAASTDPQKGGHLFVRLPDGVNIVGSYTALEPGKQVGFTLRGSDDPGASSVRVALAAQGDGTSLTLTHEFAAYDPAWAEAAARWSAVWPAALENLVSVLETGIDLREARRPRLGILMDDTLSEDFLRQSGVPVKSGVRLLGVAEGSGAQAAGLQKDDVLVSLDGVALESPASFIPALRGFKAGDRPVVEYYRGAQKLKTPLELGTFPTPELPDTAAGAAQKVRDAYPRVLVEMRKQIGDLTDEQAARRPAPEEWSVRELVAHFILCERDYQNWVAGMINDVAVEDWLEMRPNITPRLQALTARMPRLADLFAELALAYEETAATIEAFPETFVQRRKHLYRRAAQWAIEWIPEHYFDEHREQFQAAIDAARG
jgi:uncharacterized protein YndB with AHSA1/START domain